MIVDSSAILSILYREPNHERLIEQLVAEPAPGVGTPTLAETGIVLAGRLGPAGRSLLARFLDQYDVDPIPFTEEHWGVAVDAFTRFGRGRHPARLNLGDCFTYAIAKLADEPLLTLGDDFAKTDLTLVA